MRRSSRPAVLLATVLGLSALSGAGCTEERSYAVITVRAAEGEFVGVSQFMVRLWNGQRMDLRYFPREMRDLSFSTTQAIDFSVGFSASISGTLRVGVTPLDRASRALGYGELTQPIDRGHVTRMTIVIIRGAQPPTGDADAGVRPDGLGDSARSVCEPTNPTTCGAGRTCYIGCFGSEAAGLCATAGAGKPGDTCTGNGDCQPGTQCLNAGCGSSCVRFCKTDGDCGAGRCNRELPCGATPSGQRLCTQDCDPRGEGKTGCAAGLSCLLVGQDQVNCECAGPRRVAGDGAPCTDLADCRPGLVCVAAGAGDAGESLVCRPICKRSENDCPAGRTCAQLRNPDFTVWGACL